jgi:hypothetical protein
MAKARVAASPTVPSPPGLHWAIVLALGIVTVGIFLDIWLIVQARWVRKFEPTSKALPLAIVSIVVSVIAEILNSLHAPTQVAAVAFVVSFVLALVPTFSVRDSLARYLSGRTGRPAYLGSFLTLILGPIYLQFHMNKVGRT